ncbi:MAG: flagellar biosynthetic protein FliR [Deltaproteobacteria bacterium]|nr:flagellar biosynthetic protein FliR [Deltaproteobacteria bacterium]
MLDAVPHGLGVTFGMVLTRVGALFLALPIFLGELAPLRIRVAVIVMLAAVLSLATPAAPLALATRVVVPALVGEFLLGLFLGLTVRAVFAAAEMAGELVGVQMGLGFAAQADPLLEHAAGPFTRLFSVTMALLFFALDGDRAIIRALVQSLVAVPPGTARSMGAWVDLLTTRTGALFAEGLRIAGPVLVTVLAAQLSLGLLGRVAPQLNLWAIGFLVIVGVGLLSASLFVPALVADLENVVKDGVLTLGVVH